MIAIRVGDGLNNVCGCWLDGWMGCMSMYGWVGSEMIGWGGWGELWYVGVSMWMVVVGECGIGC